MSRCKITILKRTLHQDLIDAYKTPEAAAQFGACPLFHEGQEFIVDSPWSPPALFCSWAWADFRQYMLNLCLDGEFPTSNPSNIFITCCTDGFRPVIFKLERID
jgi:uncharacterized repeat protein (TIGR04076 family)